MVGGLAWYGGKNNRVGAWVSRLLPVRRAYLEPCAGMLGVLLRRRRSRLEVVNDASADVVGWWRALRADPRVFADAVSGFPCSRLEYGVVRERLRSGEGSEFERAVWFHVAMANSFGAVVKSAGWRVERGGMGRPYRWAGSRFEALASRIADVRLEHGDACELVEAWAGVEDVVVYLDPPYRGDGSRYGCAVDVERMASALLACKGFVAVSGYGGDWDRLGWRRLELPHLNRVANGADRAGVPVVECLWVNGAVESQGGLF